MPGNTIERLLDGTYRDPESGQPIRVDTRSLVIAESLAGQEVDLLRALELGRRLAIVCDRNTHQALGARVEQMLRSAFEVDCVVLDAGPHADEATVATIRRATARADALVAIGSGTISDLCKFASATDRKPYIVFATAPSMNGYTSLNAAITVHGHKKSLAAHAPIGAFFDLEVLATAPLRMIRSGLGDSLCRSTAQADWLLAHHLLEQPYRKLPFALLAEDEGPLFDAAGALVAGDPSAMRYLVRTLVLSGFGTAICGDSRPASQGEHLISHYVDMLGDRSWPEAFHGEQIGVTTLTMARLQEVMLADAPPILVADAEDAGAFELRFGPALAPSCWAEFAQKRNDSARAWQLTERLELCWPRIRDSIAAISKPAVELQQVLERAGAPTSAADLGWPTDFYQDAIRSARLIRNRYTFLDLAAGARRLKALVA